MLRIYPLIKLLMPLSLRKFIKDRLEAVIRQFPGRHDGKSLHGLTYTQVYPKGKNFFSVLEVATKEKMLSIDLIPTTPVASIGTCFAEEFAFFMRDSGFNYIYTEQDKLAASANWGRVYTIPNLLQIVRYSVEDDYPVIIEKTEKGWFDPLRENALFLSKKEAEEAIKRHRRASYEAFTQCEILIITVGQNETWKDSDSNLFWARTPPALILSKRKQSFSVVEFSFVENYSSLKDAVKLLQKVNPTIKIIFTVSPVASYATFSDSDVITKSFANKCVLRAVVNDLVATQSHKLFYFPSFEAVLCDNPHNFRADNRHVKYSTVKRIFSLLANTTSLN